MVHCPNGIRLLTVSVCLFWAALGKGQDILDNVPADALGFVTIRNLQQVRAHFTALTTPMIANPAVNTFPVGVLTAFLGSTRQLDLGGDMLFVVSSSERPLGESPLAVWLPVRDYGEFARSLGGNPDERITVVTVQGEDILCARHREKWAVLMDAGDRRRLESLLDGDLVPPPPLANWRDWLRTNLLAAAVLPTPSSRAALREWAGDERGQKAGGSVPLQTAGVIVETGVLAPLRTWLLNAFSTSPQLSQWAMDSQAIAVGAGFDKENIVVGMRMAWPSEPWQARPAGDLSVPVLHRDGMFALSGAGRLPGPFARAIAESVLRSGISQMQSDNSRSTFDAELIERFIKKGEEAASQVHGAALFHSPGGERDGVFTNQFLAVRVDSAADFSGKVADAAKLWNDISATAQPSTKSVFEIERLDMGGRKAVHLSLDVIASEGLPDSPELRQLMERLFGPDRKLHRWVVELDERTVLLASATTLQTAGVVRSLLAAPAGDWTANNVTETDRLLPKPSDWKLFFNPSDYVMWLRRVRLAEFGDAVGDIPLDPFPATPPVGVAGRFAGNELTVDVVIPQPTFVAAHRYWAARSLKQRAER